jgi:hypothetical protein
MCRAKGKQNRKQTELCSRKTVNGYWFAFFKTPRANGWDDTRLVALLPLTCSICAGSLESEAGIFACQFDKTGTRLVTAEVCVCCCVCRVECIVYFCALSACSMRITKIWPKKKKNIC